MKRSPHAHLHWGRLKKRKQQQQKKTHKKEFSIQTMDYQNIQWSHVFAKLCLLFLKVGLTPKITADGDCSHEIKRQIKWARLPT